MGTAVPGDGPLSFLGITIRRAFVIGRPYLIYGLLISTLMGIGLGSVAGPAFSQAFPLILPIFTAVGAQGALMVFSNDRVKGVLEYLMAYGVTPRQQFFNVLVASLVQVTVVVGFALGVSLTVYVARGNTIPISLVQLLVVYSVPMSFASGAFATVVGMIWTTISSPRFGLSSPTGLAPFIGILPPVSALGLVAAIGISAGAVTQTTFLLVTGLTMGAVAVAVVPLLGLSARLLRRERFLSPA